MFSWYRFCSDQTERCRREVRSYALVNFSGFYRYVFGGETRIFARIGWNCCDIANKKLSWIALYLVDEAGQPNAINEQGLPVAFCSIPDSLSEPFCEPVSLSKYKPD